MSTPNETYGRRREAFEIELYRTLPDEQADALKVLVISDPAAIGPMLGAVAAVRKGAFDSAFKKWEVRKDQASREASEERFVLLAAVQKLATIWAECEKARKECEAETERKLTNVTSLPSAR